MRQGHFPRPEDPAPDHVDRHLGAYQRNDRGTAGGGRATVHAPPRSWYSPGQYGGRLSAPETSLTAAGAAEFGVSRVGRLGLYLQPLPSRRYPRPRAVKEGRDGTEGSFTPQRASLWRNNGASLRGLEQSSMHLPSARGYSGGLWMSWTPVCLGIKGQMGWALDLGTVVLPRMELCCAPGTPPPPWVYCPAEFGRGGQRL